jgi:uncharacterized protein YaeQ
LDDPLVSSGRGVVYFGGGLVFFGKRLVSSGRALVFLGRGLVFFGRGVSPRRWGSVFLGRGLVFFGRPLSPERREIIRFAMALTSTIYNFDVELADSDRGVYETLAVRAALHPSETEEYLWTRVLAYCLEYEEGIAFSKGLSDGDEPALWIRDPAGRVKLWIEVGTPDAARLHKAAKAADRVAVYTHKEPRSLLRRLEGERIHRAEEIPIRAVDRQLLADLVAVLDRRMKLQLSVTGGHLYLDIAGRSLSGAVTEHRIGEAA